MSISADPNGRRESVTLTNVSAAPIDLDAHVLKSEPQSYHFGPGSVIPAGGSMRIQVVGTPRTTPRWTSAGAMRDRSSATPGTWSG